MREKLDARNDMVGRLQTKQQEFIQEFLLDTSPRFQELVSPVGTGKTHTAILLVEALREAGQAKRFLYLTPAPLAQQAAYELKEMVIDLSILHVTRQRFRELQAERTSNHSFWPEACVVVMSIDFAKKDDIVSAIKEVCWDLVIVDEAHRLAGLSANLLQEILATKCAERLLLMTATPESSHVEISDLTRTDWTPYVEEMLGRDRPSPVVELVEYSHTPEEQECLQQVGALHKEVKEGSGAEFFACVLGRKSESSIFALESLLRRIRNGLAHSGFAQVKEHLPISLPDESESVHALRWKDPPQTLRRIEEILEGIENLERDSKLEALVNKLSSLFSGDQSCLVCVTTAYLETANYLESALTEGNMAVFAISGGMRYEERVEQSHLYCSDGGILVATDAALEGPNLCETDYLVHYDAPADDTVEAMRLARVWRVGRKKPLHVIRLHHKD